MKFQATDDKVKVLGRTICRDGIRYLSYSGSSAAFTFVGKKAQVRICTDGEKHEETLKGYVAVYINDETEPRMRFRLEEPAKTYTIYEAKEEETVTVRLVKYSEAAFAKCGIEWFEIDTEKLLAPPARKERRIEYIGDSITCGYGVEGKDETETFNTWHENPAKSYSLLSANALDADMHLVSWSGIGIISRWVEADVTEPLDDWLMPMLYQYTDASLCKEVFEEEEKDWEKWDHTRFVPDVVIINLGTNDESWCKDITERQENFAREFKKFVQYVRKMNPQAEMFCVYGVMEALLLPVEKRIIAELSEADKKLHMVPLPLQDREHDKLGSDFHPSEETQQKDAAIVVEAVRKVMGW